MKKMKQKKLTYEVQDHETIDQCLDRIQKDGYLPIKRIERPIFQEKVENNQIIYEPIDSQVLFEVRKIE